MKLTTFNKKEFYDILIDNQSIRTLLDTQNITPFWGVKKEQYLSLACFKLNVKPILKSGNVELLVCSECGDIGCGSVTVRIEEKDGYIFWKDFLYENDIDEYPTEDSECSHVGPFVFDRQEYFKAFNRIRI